MCRVILWRYEKSSTTAFLPWVCFLFSWDAVEGVGPLHWAKSRSYLRVCVSGVSQCKVSERVNVGSQWFAVTFDHVWLAVKWCKVSSWGMWGPCGLSEADELQRLGGQDEEIYHTWPASLSSPLSSSHCLFVWCSSSSMLFKRPSFSPFFLFV